jgi:NADH-quinone oxidoreductase subunit L
VYLIILLIPLLASIIANNRLNGKGGQVLSVIGKIISSILTLIIFYEVAITGSPVILDLGEWKNIGSVQVHFLLNFDTLTVSKYLPIILISTLIQIYSLEYKGHDPHRGRFFSLLSLFAFTMLILVTGNNLLTIL